jgi:Fe-S protein assembly chaperone HscA
MTTEKTTGKELIVGIDLGTTNSLVAYMHNEVPEVIEGLLPSVVYYAPGGEITVGENAKVFRSCAPSRTFTSIKTLMGLGLSDLGNTRGALKLEELPYQVNKDSQNIIEILVDHKKVNAIVISAEILKKLKITAEKKLKQSIHKAVITVPAYFNDAQRQATAAAGKLAGLEVVRMINEPTAASLAYGLGHKKDGVIAVYDFGGGTFDLSILKIKDGVFEVLATHGDTHLGGDNLDMALADWMLSQMKLTTPVTFELKAMLAQAAEKTKITLSKIKQTKIHFSYQHKDYEYDFSRSDLEKLMAPFVDETIKHCETALKDAKLSAKDITDVVLVGGSTRIPLVYQKLKTFFYVDPNDSLNPDQAVALGAAIQADILMGNQQDTLLIDVIPLSLGIETMGGVVSKLLHRNSKIPTRAKEGFTTWVEGQTKIDIHVVQGERELVTDCRSLGRFTLEIPPMPAGAPRIEVTFAIDANGILHVTAHDHRSGERKNILIKPTFGLSDEQVEKMLLESFDHAQEDLDKRQLIEAQNEARQVIDATEKGLKKQVNLVSLAEETKILAGLDTLKKLMAGTDHNAIRDHIKVVDELTHGLAEKLMDSAIKSTITNTKV